MQTVLPGSSAYQVPQIDLNFGVGERLQLTFEIPYELETASGQPDRTGWSNAYPGIKWRFVDQGKEGWQVSTFPQIETAASPLAVKRGLAGFGPRYLLPVEVARKWGPLDVDVEAGYYFPGSGPRERILGLVTGRAVTERLELDAEIYDDRAYDPASHVTTLDMGARYKLGRGFIALFMAGRGISGIAQVQPEFMGYIGIQILLSHFGRTLSESP